MSTAKTTTAKKGTAEKTAAELNAERLGTDAKSLENTVEVEEGLTIEVVVKPTDMRLALALRKFKKLNKYADNFSDEQAEEFMDVIFGLLELLISDEDMDRVTEFYVRQHGEFSVEDMSNLIEKAFGANEKK
jgi:hypothetical protein